MGFFDRIQEWARDVYEDIKDLPEDAQDLIGRVKTAGGWLGRAICSALMEVWVWVVDEGADLVGRWIMIAAVNLAHGAAVLLYPVSVIVSRVLRAAFEITPVEWIPFVEQYMESVTGTRMELPKGAILRAWDLGHHMTQQMASEVYRKMLSAIMPTKEELQKNPYIVAERFLNYNMRFQMDSFGLHMLIELSLIHI